MKRYFSFILCMAFICGAFVSCTNSSYKTLIVTGQSPEDWKASSQAIKNILDETGLFSTDICQSPAKGSDMSGFSPDFSKYKLVVLDYDGDKWPEKTTIAFDDYVKNGGGAVLFISKTDIVPGMRDTITYSKPHSYEVRVQPGNHPVTDGLPVRWLHATDVIIQGFVLKGEGLQILATAFSDTAFAGNGKSEPVLFTRNLNKGRVFGTLLGSTDGNENPALHCAGFIVTLQRGAEWAASGKVTQEIPFDFPTVAGVVTRSGFNTITPDEAFGKIGSYDIGKSTKYYTCIQNSLRKAAGDAGKLSDLEKRMVRVLQDPKATAESKRLMLRELSWMGTVYCLPAVKELAGIPELKDEADFALTRLNPL